MPNELIKDKESFDPVKSANPILLENHTTLHEWWVTILKGEEIKGWSREDIHAAHNLAAKEMTKRKLGIDKDGKHASPLPLSLHELAHTDPKKKKKIPYTSNAPVVKPDPKILAEDKHIDEFHRMCLEEQSEEFDFALSQGWITPELIPQHLTHTAHAELRNQDSFLLKKTIGSRAIICLRAEDNSISAEKVVELQ